MQASRIDHGRPVVFNREERLGLLPPALAQQRVRLGLFKLVQRSNKPEAGEFDRWVRHEVLPQIMDNGGYFMPEVGGCL
nr:BRO family protein [Novosphingobium panipatense]